MVKFQKRGLPHAHILLWLRSSDIIHADQIDKYICAEIPNPEVNPELHDIVVSNMIHRHSLKCINRNISGCSKGFPKSFRTHTSLNEGQWISRGTTRIDNGQVVPYSPYLSRIYKCHINVELCTTIRSISYVLKYVNKGSDKLTFVVRSDNATHDEIETYRTARYVSSNEAVWRILSFDIHENSPSVIILTIHLPGQQLIYYDEARPVDLSRAPPTKLTKFFELCTTTASASNLIYADELRLGYEA